MEGLCYDPHIQIVTLEEPRCTIGRAGMASPNNLEAYIILTPTRDHVKSRLGVNLWGALIFPSLTHHHT
ncbi:Uncharacterized protein HZ326_27391 [Fusarium oxysporum f. sp. albedinis]|nr:Uncharacterized protein HZ326_27391 [Fusarium oxysporum f. sp. albedinis]